MKWVDSIAFALVAWAYIAGALGITPAKYYQAKEASIRQRQDAETAAMVERAKLEIEARGTVN